jgi:hypothetical protein
LNNFDEIRRIVMADSTLMASLTSIETTADLFSRVIALAREQGIEITVAELEGVAQANRRAWLERWLI